jgi:hypothetical protein
VRWNRYMIFFTCPRVLSMKRRSETLISPKPIPFNKPQPLLPPLPAQPSPPIESHTDLQSPTPSIFLSIEDPGHSTMQPCILRWLCEVGLCILGKGEVLMNKRCRVSELWVVLNARTETDLVLLYRRKGQTRSHQIRSPWLV